MMKYKPKAFPFTQAVAEMGSNGWTLVAGLVEFAGNLALTEKGIPPTYSCGKRGCTGTFSTMSKSERPLVCPKCGSEIDWIGIATKKVKRCPVCHKAGSDLDIYCKYHVPGVPLKEYEEPI
jgi:hypothetical protein